MRFLVATNNTHKFREIRELMPDKFELVNQIEFNIPSPKETGLTFIENALIKAL